MLLAESLTEQVIGLAIEVHRNTGLGLLEAVYEQSLCVGLRRVGVHARTAAVCDRAVGVLPGIGQWRQHDRVKRQRWGQKTIRTVRPSHLAALAARSCDTG